EGRQEGRQEGLKEGLLEGETAVFLRLFERRFGQQAMETHRKRIQAADPETLLRWSDRILTAETADEVFD
ncbi:MAG: Rpn family recombination-promoting nuclease/putative transposase, partial [Pseudomonadota bacterium]